MTSLRKPLSRVGKVAQRWGSWQESQRRIVSLRSRGRCELCGVQGLGLEVHHTAGRRNNIGEPYASWAVMLAGLCRPCHRTVHLEGKADQARLATVQRLSELGWVGSEGLDPLDAIREAVRRMEEKGFDPREKK